MSESEVEAMCKRIANGPLESYGLSGLAEDVAALLSKQADLLAERAASIAYQNQRIVTLMATPVQPTDWHGSTIGYRDNKATFAGDPPVQPTEAVRGQLLCLHDRWRCGRPAMPNSWCCDLHHGPGFERAHPAVQPTEPLPADVQTEIDRLQGLIKTAYELSPHEDDDDYNYGWADWRKDASIEAKNWKSAFDSLRERIKELEAAAPVQPTEPEWKPIQPNVTCPACGTGLGARWLTQDDVEPPVQPPEPPKVYAPCVCSSPESIKLRNDEDGRWSCPRHGHMPKYPPVQPTEPVAFEDWARENIPEGADVAVVMLCRRAWRAAAPVQPMEPRESDPIAGISKRLDAALRSKG